MAEARAIPGLEELAEAAGPPRGLWSDAFRRLIRNRLAMPALILLSVLAVLAIAGNTIDWVQRYEPTYQDYSVVKTGPSWDHFFGTDNLGRDNWARVLEGLLISLQVGFGVQAAFLTIGITVGGTAALTGRLGDNILMRLTDLTYAFPDLLFIILIRSVLFGRDWPVIGHERILVIFAISFVSWTPVAGPGARPDAPPGGARLRDRGAGVGSTRARVVFQHM